MTLELQIINDESVSVGELKKFLSTIPDNLELVVEGLYARKLLIHTDRNLGTCEIKLESQNYEIQRD